MPTEKSQQVSFPKAPSNTCKTKIGNVNPHIFPGGSTCRAVLIQGPSQAVWDQGLQWARNFSSFHIRARGLFPSGLEDFLKTSTQHADWGRGVG